MDHHLLRAALRAEREQGIIRRSFYNEETTARPSARSALTLDQGFTPPARRQCTPIFDYAENAQELPSEPIDYVMLYANVLKHKVLYVYAKEGTITHIGVVDPTNWRPADFRQRPAHAL